MYTQTDNDPKFKEAVRNFAKLLKIPLHEDDMVTLKAVVIFVEERLSEKGLQEYSNKSSKVSSVKIIYVLDKFFLDSNNLSLVFRTLCLCNKSTLVLIPGVSCTKTCFYSEILCLLIFSYLLIFFPRF